VDDLIKSMKAHLYDRVSSPLMFSFLCSWAIWNYRLLIIVLSGADPEKKFAQIEALPSKSYLLHLFSDWPPEAYWLCNGFAAPLLTTLFYLLILPWFEAKALKISLEKSVKLKRIKLAAENATPIAHGESIYLRDKIREAEEARDAAIERQRASMQTEIDKKQKELNDSHNEIIQNNQAAVLKETELQNQINMLKQEKENFEPEKENLEHQVKEAERLATVVFGLDDGARELIKLWGDGRVRKLSEMVRSDSRVQGWFSQLYQGGLATQDNGSPRLTPPAERLLLDHRLSQRES
jgi:hypothetical protein